MQQHFLRIIVNNWKPITRMLPVKKKKKNPSNENVKQKERHIVTWTQEEDDLLREQISILGTENWTIIASNFKDKTTRQCRRRWYTYLNSDFKKGGWSPEEDLLLCEAQKIFGNRWTKIAKVVSGRTDNAVKNRFSTLSKKKAKYEALTKENSSSYTSSNEKRINFQRDFTTDAISPAKKLRRSHVCEITETIDFQKREHKQCETTIQDHDRAPLTILAQNAYNLRKLAAQQIKVDGTKVTNGVYHDKNERTFHKKDDPKISALMQQAELLTSLAEKVNAEISDQSLENAWKVLQDHLNQSKETDSLRCKIPDLHADDLKHILEDLRSSIDGSTQSWRQPNLYEDSPGSSEYSIGSTLLPQSVGDRLHDSLCQNAEVDLKAHDGGVENSPEGEKGVLTSENIGQDILSSYCDKLNKDEVLPTMLSAEFSSPIQVTPLFKSLAAGIPSPKFSESERNFLMKTLGIESPSPNPCKNASQPPPCKRSLLQSL